MTCVLVVLYPRNGHRFQC